MPLPPPPRRLHRTLSVLLVLSFFSGLLPALHAARVVEVQVMDQYGLVVHVQDGTVEYHWDDLGAGSCNGWDVYHTENWHLCDDKDTYIAFGDPLDTGSAQRKESYAINGPTGALNLRAVYRKSKVWEASHDERKPVMHHWLYLDLAEPMRPGAEYRVHLAEGLGVDKCEIGFVYDPITLESPSIKVSHAGYEATAPYKTADIYLWMGDGGGRDFGRLEGAPWHLHDLRTGEIAHSGKLNFRMKATPEPHSGLDLTRSDVWECDFSEFSKPGTYRLVVEGVGASAPFKVTSGVFAEPFRVAMQGMFYQRMGCDEEPGGGYPKARQPLFRQGVDPEEFVVYLSARNMVTGRNPDDRKWYAEDLTGEIVEATWGGWSDAYDNDQRPVNFVCVFDLLLAYTLNPEAFTDGQLFIPERDNGIPDIVDEALWEIDWWLRMRDQQGGYLTGLTNIVPPETTNYAGAPCAWQGWCVAAGAAMAADCFRLSGHPEQQAKYLQAAIEAYEWAESRKEQMLDVRVNELRGRDLRMTAAAYLYNLTGDVRFERTVIESSEANSHESEIMRLGSWAQQYATVGYLLSPQPIHDRGLQERMIQSILHQARVEHVRPMQASATRSARWTAAWDGVAKTSAEMTLAILAHRWSEDAEERKTFASALHAEAEWTLGRNPLGLVQMTGLTDRAITQPFAPGRRDGAPGLTPGWTPYMCRDGWDNGDDIHRCEWYTNRNYPSDKFVWPEGEHFWNSRYSVPNSEATPQQTFRQKILLYGYLFGVYSQGERD